MIFEDTSNEKPVTDSPGVSSARSHNNIRWTVFALVAAAFCNIYITQPILPLLESEFQTSTVSVAKTVSAVLLGIVFANLPFGYLADRFPIKPILLIGGGILGLAGLVAAASPNIEVLIGARFVQGCFVPPLTTCLAAYLARTLPPDQLNVALGSYVAATLMGGMCSRLLAGFVLPPTEWRLAMVIGALLVFFTCALAARFIPAPSAHERSDNAVSYRSLLIRPELCALFLCGAAGQAIFAPVFNTISYRLQSDAVGLSAESGSWIFFTYLSGIIVGPYTGRLSNRIGHGNAMLLGAALLGGSLLLLLAPGIGFITLALLGICCGFFALHAATVGALNSRLRDGHGRANALYVLSYYLGATIGVSWSAWVYQQFGWNKLVYVTLCIVLIPLIVGLSTRRHNA